MSFGCVGVWIFLSDSPGTPGNPKMVFRPKVGPVQMISEKHGD